MDHLPREMKEPIGTRRNQTVLPLLSNNKKDTLQAIHTSVVNRVIDNMADNRVLNNQSPPINDEKTHLDGNSITALFRTLLTHVFLQKATEDN